MARAPIKALPDTAELNRLFDYDPKTGVLSWKWVRSRAYRIKVGDPAGTVTTRGYLNVGIGRRYYYAHRIIWKMMTGIDPEDQIDHIDGNRLNNRWANLRAADNSRNMFNRRINSNNRSGVKGVCWVRSHNAWKAYVTTDGKQKQLGRFKSLADACAARRTAAEKLHGEFFRAA